MQDGNQINRRLSDIERTVNQLLAPKSKARIVLSDSAFLATFTLTANLAVGGTAAATVISTNDPALSVGNSITVMAAGDERSYTGCKGLAIKVDNEWWVVKVDQHAILWEATLTDETHDFSVGGGNVPGAVASQQTIAFTSKEAMTPWPFSYLPTSPAVTNPSNFVGVIGDKILVLHERSTDVNEIIAIFPATARAFQFEYTADRGTGLTPSTAAKRSQALIGFSGDLPSTFNAKDSYYVGSNAKSGDKGIVVWDLNLEAWHIIASEHTATRVLGTLYASFSGAAATFSVTPVTGLNGKTPSGTLTVQNRYSWDTGTSGHKIEIEWDPINGQWNPVQMRCPS